MRGEETGSSVHGSIDAGETICGYRASGAINTRDCGWATGAAGAGAVIAGIGAGFVTVVGVVAGAGAAGCAGAACSFASSASCAGIGAAKGFLMPEVTLILY